MTAGEERLRVFTPGQPAREIPTVYSVDGLWGVSQDGARACVTLLGAGVAVVDLKTGVVDLVTGLRLPTRAVLMSPDGSGIFWRALGPEFGVTPGRRGIVRFDLKSRELEVLAESESPFEAFGASISPSGQRLYFFSYFAGIMEFDVETRRFSRLLADKPYPGVVPAFLSPATWMRLYVSAAVDETRVLIGGLDAAVYIRESESVVVVPDPLTPLGETELRLVNDASPFEPEVRPVVVHPRVPRFVTLGSLGPQEGTWGTVALIFEEQTGDLVNPWRPVRREEVLRVYVTGIAEGPEHVEWSAEIDGRPVVGPEVLSMDQDPNLAAWWIARVRVQEVSQRGSYLLCLTPDGEPELRGCTSFPVTPD